jgi:NADPH:quinone reductase-like Zn-dependent oxidoreductase
MIEGSGMTTIKMAALLRDRYGTSDVLRIGEIDRPELSTDGILVRVRAISVNRVDWYAMTGRPTLGRVMMGLRKPKNRRLGTDFAGVVEAVGSRVTEFRAGDEVFGGANGACAEYVVAVPDDVAHKPSRLGFEEAAAVPMAGLTALQGLRDRADVKPGQRVLVNGASGGVGTFAIQVAKALGAEVTAVSSTRNVEMARTLGADHVIDYTCDDFTRSDQRYDVLFDNAGNRSWSDSKRVLTASATVVLVGGPITNRLLGPLGHIVRMRLAAAGGERKAVFFIADFNSRDLQVLRDMLETGTLKPVIDRRYEFTDVADAFSYVGEGHSSGKVVVGGL